MFLSILCSRVHIKEKFLADLKKIRDTITGEELSSALKNMRKRLDDPRVLCGEVVYSMLISFRDIQVKKQTLLIEAL